MATILEKIDQDVQRAAVPLFGRTRHLDETRVIDALCDLMHLGEAVAVLNRAQDDNTDARRLVLRMVESACAHYLAEAHAKRENPAGDADELGGYYNPNVKIAQADDSTELY